MENLKYNLAKDNISTLELNPPRLMKYLIEKKSEFVKNIIEVSKIIEPVLNRISNIFPSYTLHDINHSIRIMEYMFDLINDVNNLSDLEISILIYSALLHDIGMYASDEECETIKTNKNYISILKKYNNEKISLQDYIRKFHATRSHDFIIKNLKEFLVIPSQPSISFYDDISLCCESHTKDITWLNNKLKTYNQKYIYNYNLLFTSILLRLGDILDIDSNRTPPFLYTLINPYGISNLEWKQHFVIYNKEKIIVDKSLHRKIVLMGECSDPSIHRKILMYLDWINDEIINSNNLTDLMEDKYQLKLKYPLENKIEAKGYKISNLKLNIDYNAISNLLMGEKIYGNKSLGLRELIQNSIDACNVRKEYENKSKQSWECSYFPLIQIILDKNSNKFIIKDNGTGMTLEIIKNYFLNIGVSYYKSDDFLLNDFTYTPIGNFGIGFLSCFMLSNDVVVKTRNFKDSIQYTLQLSKDSQYICLNESRDLEFQGTEIILKYDQVFNIFENNIEKLKQFINEHFLTEGLFLRLINIDDINKSCEFINLLNTVNKKASNNANDTYTIDVSKYLKEINGFITISYNNIKNNILSMCNDKECTYLYYDGSSLIDIDDNFDFSLVYDNYCINHIDIPIIDSYDEFEKYYDVLNDEDEAIEKIKTKLRWLCILVNKTINFKYNENGYVIRNWDTIIGDYEFNILKDYGHDVNCETKVYYKKLNLVHNLDTKKSLKFEQIERIPWHYYQDILTYLRNILVKNSNITISPKISHIKIHSINLNIINKNICTNISRNDLDEESLTLLNYAIGKTIHKWLLDNLDQLDKFKNALNKDLLEEFINTSYKENNILLL